MLFQSYPWCCKENQVRSRYKFCWGYLLINTVKELDKDRLTAFLLGKQCDFTMNIPDASHMEGVLERQIRTVRSILNYIFSKRNLPLPGKLDDASLRKSVYEAMSVVNSCPLITDSISEPKNLKSLKPNLLVTMRSFVLLHPPGHFVADNVYVRKRWHKVIPD